MASKASGPSSSTSTGPSPSATSGPPCILVLGMAGSGKSAFVQRLTSHLHMQKKAPYVINLDPAVHKIPYPANIDIRDTVLYKEVMKEYGLGPNGAIMTCLNLMCTRFDQVMDILKKRSDSVSHCVVDTPGQIEAFTWSASGSIITDTMASVYPTCIAYVIDSARATNPTTFMSNMLYACSILYRTKLPFFLVLNKADIVKPTFAIRWMTDFEAFEEALNEAKSSYMNDLTRSMSLVLDQFYEKLNYACVSSLTGEGMDDVLAVIEKCVTEYHEEYRPMYEKAIKERQEETLNKMGELTVKEKVACDMTFDENYVPPTQKVHLGEGVEEDEGAE
ncbi:hypothetical protein QR680_000364 [Steinernema hermaphroditum]|uniref:GPN-loop GTPase n=1 Tax=Steinernema hermaphroditum TaxID=289476 RepID=A0AA39GV76_9BILA|nr:hypothetical protein QR680_000364 [Steinernema hermaphroditum]